MSREAGAGRCRSLFGGSVLLEHGTQDALGASIPMIGWRTPRQRRCQGRALRAAFRPALTAASSTEDEMYPTPVPRLTPHRCAGSLPNGTVALAERDIHMSLRNGLEETPGVVVPLSGLTLVCD